MIFGNAEHTSTLQYGVSVTQRIRIKENNFTELFVYSSKTRRRKRGREWFKRCQGNWQKEMAFKVITTVFSRHNNRFFFETTWCNFFLSKIVFYLELQNRKSSKYNTTLRLDSRFVTFLLTNKYNLFFQIFGKIYPIPISRLY